MIKRRKDRGRQRKSVGFLEDKENGIHLVRRRSKTKRALSNCVILG